MQQGLCSYRAHSRAISDLVSHFEGGFVGGRVCLANWAHWWVNSFFVLRVKAS